MRTYNASIELPLTELAPRTARRLVAEMLRAWEWDAEGERDIDAVLLVNEIVANVVDHTERDASLVLELAQSDSWLRVSSTDSSAVHPIVYEMDQRARRGRGMQIVAALAQRWGVDDVHGGKRVWFELAAEVEPPGTDRQGAAQGPTKHPPPHQTRAPLAPAILGPSIETPYGLLRPP